MTLDGNIFNDVFLSPFSSNTPLTPISKMLVSMNGINSGVPTLTTSTLTPTTLRNIERDFIELTSEPPTSMPYLAGFVPPIVPSNFQDSHDNNSMGSSESLSQSSWHTPLSNEENSTATTDNSNAASILTSCTSFATTKGLSTCMIPSTANATNLNTSGTSSSSGTTRKNLGGRRPAKASNLSPEEEEKRKIRRERNKLAAARCRKRRVDLTNELMAKVQELEQEKQGLQKTIEELRFIKDELQLGLEAHRIECRRSKDMLGRASPLDVKPNILSNTFDLKMIKDEPLDPIDSLDGPPSPKRIMLTANNPTVIAPLPNVSTIAASLASNISILNTPTVTSAPPLSMSSPFAKQNRPSTLNVPLTLTPAQAFGLNRNITDIAGVPITTPSNGTFNFDSLMDGGTGLTPVSNLPLMPTCSSQNNHPLELKTPTSEPSKLVSL